MKIMAGTLFGVMAGMIIMYILRPMMWPEPEKIRIIEQIQYQTRWKVKKEISMDQAKKCVFSPIVITADIKENTAHITAKDDCKEAKKDLKLKTKENYLKQAMIGTGAAALGFIGGVVLSR